MSYSIAIIVGVLLGLLISVVAIIEIKAHQ